MIAKLVRGVLRSKDLSKPIAHYGLLSRQDFARVLQRERDRTDRTGDEFSLLALLTGCERKNRDVVAQTASLLVRRLRSTDEAGWLDGQTVAALLPATPPDGAWKVANDIRRSFPAGARTPACRIYCYPSQWFTDVARKNDPAETTVSDIPQHAAHSGEPMETLFQRRMPVWKRGLDIVGASVAMVLLSPVLLIVAVLVKLTSPGPALFAQRRNGLGGKQFVLYKFRSMVVDAEKKKQELLALNEQDGPAFKIKADPRITPVGRFLRKTSLDELPQLWNVLKGEMSLVGPRPLPCSETAACQGWHRRRLDVTPGLTCIWQVSGRSSVSFDEWVRMDVRYIRSRGLFRDLKLLLLTVPSVLLRKGV